MPGCHSVSTEVDHIVPKAEGGGDDDDNLRDLCKPCHNVKTVRGGRRWGGSVVRGQAVGGGRG